MRGNRSMDRALEIKGVTTLHREGVIGDDVKSKIDRIWERRNDFHHLDPSTAQGHRLLEELAREKLTLLSEVQAERFGYSLDEGSLRPNNPKYWDIQDGMARGFLRKW